MHSIMDDLLPIEGTWTEQLHSMILRNYRLFKLYNPKQSLSLFKRFLAPDLYTRVRTEIETLPKVAKVELCHLDRPKQIFQPTQQQSSKSKQKMGPQTAEKSDSIQKYTVRSVQQLHCLTNQRLPFPASQIEILPTDIIRRSEHMKSFSPEYAGKKPKNYILRSIYHSNEQRATLQFNFNSSLSGKKASAFEEFHKKENKRHQQIKYLQCIENRQVLIEKNSPNKSVFETVFKQAKDGNCPKENSQHIASQKRALSRVSARILKDLRNFKLRSNFSSMMIECAEPKVYTQVKNVQFPIFL